MSHVLQIFISIIQPYFLAGMVPLMGVYFIIQKFYRASYIEMQRIDATTRSPIYAHFSETLTGVETLRAYGFEERFALSNEHKVDYNHR
jgi:ATP-binding cassette, subfamily C (CFTR/MRP), member 1